MAQLISYSPLKNYVGAGLGCRHRTPIEHNRVIFPACPEPKYRAVLQRVYISVAGDERMQNVLAPAASVSIELSRSLTVSLTLSPGIFTRLDD